MSSNVYFDLDRHLTPLDATPDSELETWRLKERMKTVAVALILCLNIGVDPPDVVKSAPCARLECWIDPFSMPSQKCLEQIGAALQAQYEGWHGKAKFRQSLDPTMEDVKKLCVSLRRASKNERVLFHYNGHGVPKPTANGEIWVFNKNYTQYIPLSVSDLQSWMGVPAVYVFDCSAAAILIPSFIQYAEKEHDEYLQRAATDAEAVAPNEVILLAACGATETLPHNAEYPADIFTACLTTPIKMALQWFCTHSPLTEVSPDVIDRMPGALMVRKSPMGELNWIFTAITDTIAWTVLPRELFQRLFRQDLLIASLFRNFLLAERILRSANCTPVSLPQLPPTYNHPMWEAWDLAVDICVSNLPALLAQPPPEFTYAPFFAEQLTAFEVWLAMGVRRKVPPQQLPILLQVLLSQIHRLRALELLAAFLDLGAWAVNLALIVGIFPYMLRLLQSNAAELRPVLVFIWARILAVDPTCQHDLLKDYGCMYFITALDSPSVTPAQRYHAVFVLTVIVTDFPLGQQTCLTNSLLPICTGLMGGEGPPLLRRWLCFCVGQLWKGYDEAKRAAEREATHERLIGYLADPEAEVRAAAVFALGTLYGGERSEARLTIEHNVTYALLQVLGDASPMVRSELVVALSRLVAVAPNSFSRRAWVHMERERELREGSAGTPTASSTPSSSSSSSSPSSSSASASSAGSGGSGGGGGTAQAVGGGGTGTGGTGAGAGVGGGGGGGGGGAGGSGSPGTATFESKKAGLESPSSDVVAIGSGGRSPPTATSELASLHSTVWQVLLGLTLDPFPATAALAASLIATIRGLAERYAAAGGWSRDATAGVPAKRTVSGELVRARSHAMSSGGPAMRVNSGNLAGLGASSPTMGGNGGLAGEVDNGEEAAGVALASNFYPWSIRRTQVGERDGTSAPPLVTEAQKAEREWRVHRNERALRVAEEERLQSMSCRLDDEVALLDNEKEMALHILFDAYEDLVIVADATETVSVWNYSTGTRTSQFSNGNAGNSRITAMSLINEDSEPLLMVGTNEGVVRVWRDVYESPRPRLVTGWRAMPELHVGPYSAGLITEWHGGSGHLLASGDVGVIRVWDVRRELAVHDIPTGSATCVTSLSSSGDGCLAVAGCGDGSVRVFDKRMSPREALVRTYTEQTEWIVNVHLRKGASHEIVGGSLTGDVRFWDLRSETSTKTVVAHTSGMTALAVHDYAPLFATGSHNQSIRVFNGEGTTLSTIRFHEGFLGMRIGPSTCLAFHPHSLLLAAGSTDSMISVYASNTRARKKADA